MKQVKYNTEFTEFLTGEKKSKNPILFLYVVPQIFCKLGHGFLFLIRFSLLYDHIINLDFWHSEKYFILDALVD